MTATYRDQCAAAAASMDSDHIHACHGVWTGPVDTTHGAYHRCACNHRWPTAQEALATQRESVTRQLGELRDRIATLEQRLAELRGPIDG